MKKQNRRKWGKVKKNCRKKEILGKKCRKNTQNKKIKGKK